MQNPWKGCPLSSPFVLEADFEFVEAHNFVHRHAPDRQIDLRLPPVPFLGHRDASVVILLANPGIHELDYSTNLLPHILELSVNNLMSDGGTPHYALTETFRNTPGENWWERRTKHLAEDVGGYDVLADRLLAIELHGYHSKKWSAPLANFPSQAFGFDLVRESMDRSAVIVAARCQSHWFASVPGLAQYGNLVPSLLSPRSAYLSKRNLGEGPYQRIVSAVRSR